jgi:hypothetical protein
VFQYPPGTLAPSPYQIWGDFLIWIESKNHPLKIVEVNGLIVFARGLTLKQRVIRQVKKFFGKTDGQWYEILESESDVEEESEADPTIVLSPNVRTAQQLRLFNVFTRKEYVIPFQKIYDEIKFLHAGAPVIYPQDVFENTMCPQFLLFLHIHTPTDTLLMVWDVDLNRSKWKSRAPGAIRDEKNKIRGLKFGNALVGYLTKVADKYAYILLDLATGNRIQRFSLDGYRDPVSSTEFDCQFTSFVWIAWEPQSLVEHYLESGPDDYPTASFDVYCISSGQKLYVLQCPMHFPEHLMEPVLPWFMRTDESERYWLFSCIDIFREDEPQNTMYVWDVVLQHWTILASRCVQKGDSTLIHEDKNGRIRMAKLSTELSVEFEQEQKDLAKIRWKRVPTVKEARNLKSVRLESVLRSMS